MERQDRRLQSKKEIEVDNKNTKARWILVLVFFAIAVVSLAYGLVSCLNQEPGWHKVEATSSKINCGQDFALNYYFGDQGANSVTTNKELTLLYTDAVEQAYDLFYTDAPAGGGNLRQLNDSVGQTVTVAQPLYDALALIQSYGSRYIYLAPVYVEYDRIFRSESEPEAIQNDPGQNADLMPYISQLSAFAADPQAIDLKLMDNCQVQLVISQAYQEFAKANENDTFLDFGWMKNAFIADYIANRMEEKGFTQGYLVSLDGFTRNLCRSGQEFSLDFADRLEDTIYPVGTLSYTGPASIVSFRNYPMDSRDRWQYYAFQSGRIVTCLIDPADGKSKSATDNLLAVSQSKGCAELLLQLAPVFVADTLDENALEAMDGVSCIWFDGTQLKHTGDLKIALLENPQNPAYQIAP